MNTTIGAVAPGGGYAVTAERIALVAFWRSVNRDPMLEFVQADDSGIWYKRLMPSGLYSHGIAPWKDVESAAKSFALGLEEADSHEAGEPWR